MGPVAYKLNLLAEAKIHPVFHVSLLKRAIGNHQIDPTLPKGLEMDPTNMPTPKRCLAIREISKAGHKTPQWLIQWDADTTENATWEDAFHIQSQFPEFKLKDKLAPLAGGIDKEDVGLELIQPTEFEPKKPNTWKVYKRRHKRDTGDKGNGLTTTLSQD